MVEIPVPTQSLEAITCFPLIIVGYKVLLHQTFEFEMAFIGQNAVTLIVLKVKKKHFHSADAKKGSTTIQMTYKSLVDRSAHARLISIHQNMAEAPQNNSVLQACPCWPQMHGTGNA